MTQINVSNLTFCYEGSFDNIFENVSFSIDTNWKLGFIGRNGKGKSTFFKILMQECKYQGSINAQTVFDYFPYNITEEQNNMCLIDFYESLKSNCEFWRVCYEMEKLNLSQDILYRKFSSLSYGERTKAMLSILFAGENDFLLIDEPTNHLDMEARESIKNYLNQKKGFILISHDRDLLDACIDHVLVLNRKTIEVQSGNFSSWWENKCKKDNFAKMENEKHNREISKLKKSAQRSKAWATKNESTKIGFDRIKEHDRFIDTRAYIGAKTKKMQSRVKQYERRIEREIEQKEGLLQDIESIASLKLMPSKNFKEVLIEARGYNLKYNDSKTVLDNFNFRICNGERVLLRGRNGCGKSSFIKAILAHLNDVYLENAIEDGVLNVGSNLKVSYVSQDTSFLKGNIKDYCRSKNLDESRFCAILRQLDFERVQFVKDIKDYSEGQKKKVLIASSLMEEADIYIWDEPLNYLDVFSRIQIEKLILEYKPTMIFVEHDLYFQQKIATRIIDI